MSIGIINKLEYKIAGTSSWVNIDFTPFSANYTHSTSQTGAGTLFETTVNAKLAGVTTENTDLLESLAGRKIELRVTDADGYYHYFGTATYPARISYQATNNGTPGSWCGYDIAFTVKSPEKHTIV